MEDAIVLYPSALIGHLVSMVELGKLIHFHHPSFSITILITSAPYDSGNTATYISQVSKELPSIIFQHLPTISLPPNNSSKFIEMTFEIPRLNNPNLHLLLQTISQKSNLKAFIIDFFCDAAFEVSTTLNIPTYYFFTSNASALCMLLYFPTIHKMTTKSIKYVNTCFQIPGTPPVPSCDLPEKLLDRNTKAYECFKTTPVHMGKSSGIVVNTFESFEPRALKAISDGLCIPNALTPPVYCLGPLIASNNKSPSEHECLKWLDLQPSRSVVFLCFGSMGLFSKEQLMDMAVGLENSGHRFLWVVRNPPMDGDQMKLPSEPDLDVLLPKGFLDRTKDRGLVLKSWAPQVAVLSHDSVGGFVTHCGWNSILEAVCAGVPMVAWPLYAEQRMNRLFMVEEFKLALPLDELENKFVSATELARRVRELMDSENGKAVRQQVLAMRDAANDAIVVGGSSRVALEKLATVWKDAVSLTQS